MLHGSSSVPASMTTATHPLPGRESSHRSESRECLAFRARGGRSTELAHQRVRWSSRRCGTLPQENCRRMNKKRDIRLMNLHVWPGRGMVELRSERAIALTYRAVPQPT